MYANNKYQLMDRLTVADLEYCFKQKVLKIAKQQKQTFELNQSNIAVIAKGEEVVMEKENVSEAMQQLQKTPEREKENLE